MDNKIIDLHGILTMCKQCGNTIIDFRRELMGEEYKYWCECTECGNAIQLQNSKTESMTVWNREQRE